MNVTVMRKVKFCAGHRLLGHEGKCANLHGHNYVVEFYISGNEIDELGRVVDFAVIKNKFKGWIDDNWDHGFLLWDQDKDAIEALRQVEPNRLYILPYNPTAENIARYLLTEVGPKLIESITGYSLELKRVIVWETENAFAEVAVDSQSGLSTTQLRHSRQTSMN